MALDSAEENVPLKDLNDNELHTESPEEWIVSDQEGEDACEPSFVLLTEKPGNIQQMLRETLESVLQEMASPTDEDTPSTMEGIRRPPWAMMPAGTEKLPPPLFKKLLQQPEEAMCDLFETVKKESQSARATMAVSDVGTVRQVGDGVASLWGLPQARVDDLLQFRTGVMGLVMNLETRWIDCVLLGSDEGIQGGDIVRSTDQRITVPVGERLLGRVVDPLGRPVDGRGRLFVDEQRFVEREAPGVVEREAVNAPMHTGIKAVDAIIPIGRGQRELIIGDRQTGKTSIALDAIINQRGTDVLCVYVSIGQRKSATLQVMQLLREAGALDHTVLVMASPDDPPALVYLAPYTGCTIAEAFMDRGRDVLIVYDDLTKHADAYRELSLLLRRPPGREAYPGDIFYLHARLLERAGHVNQALGGGSITALPIVETRRGNIQAYVPTNLISITDGQIYLSPELFNQGVKPAIDVGLSVSRVGGAAQTSVMRKVSGRFKLALAQYEEVAHFARFGTEIDQATRQQIVRGERLREALKQPAYSPLSLAQQVLILYAADQGALDELSPDRIAEYEARLWQYAQREHRSIIRRIEQHHELDDDLAQDLEQLMEKFSAEFS